MKKNTFEFYILRTVYFILVKGVKYVCFLKHRFETPSEFMSPMFQGLAIFADVWKKVIICTGKGKQWALEREKTDIPGRSLKAHLSLPVSLSSSRQCP